MAEVPHHKRPHWGHGALQALTVASGALAGTLIGGPVGAVVGAAAGGAAATQISPFYTDPRMSNPMQAIYLDVRTPEEQDETGVLSGAIRIPIDDLGDAWVPTLRAATQSGRFPILVYCRKGIRAQRAADYLRSRGFDAKNIGGIEVGLASRLPRRKANPSPAVWIAAAGAGGLAMAVGGYAIYCRERVLEESPIIYRGNEATVQLVYGCPPHSLGYYFQRQAKFFVRIRRPGAADFIPGSFNTKPEAEALLNEWKGATMEANPYNQGGYWTNPRQENLCGPGIGRLPAVYGAHRAVNPPAIRRPGRGGPAKPQQQLAQAPTNSTALYIVLPPSGLGLSQPNAALLVLRVGNKQQAAWIMYERVAGGKARVVQPLGTGWNFAHQYKGMVLPFKGKLGNPALPVRSGQLPPDPQPPRRPRPRPLPKSAKMAPEVAVYPIIDVPSAYLPPDWKVIHDLWVLNKPFQIPCPITMSEWQWRAVFNEDGSQVLLHSPCLKDFGTYVGFDKQPSNVRTVEKSASTAVVTLYDGRRYRVTLGNPPGWSGLMAA